MMRYFSGQPVSGHLISVYTSPLLICITLLFLFISFLSAQIELTLLLSFILGIVFLAKLWSLLVFRHLKLSVKLGQNRIFQGEELTVEITAGNHKVLPVWLQISTFTGKSRFVSDAPAVESAFLLWYQTVSFVWTLTSLTRGCHQMGFRQITVSDLLGYYPHRLDERRTEEVIVCPRISPVRPFTPPKQIFFGTPGSRSPVHDPVYILGTRTYQNAIPVKFIHWNASARLNQLQDKVCEPSVHEKIMLLIDVDQYHHLGTETAFEEMIAAAASLAVFLPAGETVWVW